MVTEIYFHRFILRKHENLERTAYAWGLEVDGAFIGADHRRTPMKESNKLLMFMIEAE